MIYLSSLKQSLTSTFTLISVVGASIFAIATPSSAFTIGFGDDFETGGFDDWSTTGDTQVQGTLSGFYSGSSRAYHAGTGSQASLSTACPNTSGDECYQLDNPSLPRNDDFDSPAGTFNFTGNDQTDANAENSGSRPTAMSVTNLQEFFGLSANSLDIQAQEGDVDIPGGFRTAKEGSGIKLNEIIYANHDFQISFDWNYLTNDGQSSLGLGDSDYSFVVIYEENSDISTRIPIVLADSDSTTIQAIDSADTAYALSTSGTFLSETLPAGNYRVGFGVVDVDGVSRSSSLLVDNFLTEEVPFDFSPTSGLSLVAGLLLFKRLRHNNQED
ncbi:MAG: hypothetical protein ACFCAD_16005 [Pleurocapsa sp.]